MAAEGRAVLGAGRGPCGGAPWKPGFRARPGECHGPRPAACVVAPVSAHFVPFIHDLENFPAFWEESPDCPSASPRPRVDEPIMSSASGTPTRGWDRSQQGFPSWLVSVRLVILPCARFLIFWSLGTSKTTIMLGTH